MSYSSPVSPEQEEEVSQLLKDIPDRPYPTYDELDYETYLKAHLIPNRPFLLSSRTTSTWSSSHNFRLPSTEAGPSRPNLSALRPYAHHIVPIANTYVPQYSEFERTERPLGEVLDLWERGAEEGRGLYVKDWHLMAEIEGEGRGVEEVYEVPQCLRDDWLNPPYTPSPRARSQTLAKSTTASTSDFRFTYLGPPLTYTPFHRDVYGSYSWSANIVGRKIWWLFAPDKLDKVKDKHGELVFDVRKLEDEGGGVKILQEEGEVIFIPSGWHHQVVNIDFCISINHNFFASPTLPSIHHTLCVSQKRVEEAISDVKEMIIERLGTDTDAWEKEWVEEVQGLLERDAGWGWKGFWETVLQNLNYPPAAENLSPPMAMRDAWVREVIHLYKTRREWIYLAEVRRTVEEIETLLDM
ncbi:hypothetical protein CI109_103833 [Kwoniella shandongensis]|uniref:Uncharacterized protein n=1 Tax=Kwoniella shandongensis TaxID=1734106 RepID=A0A5M6C7M9_9TREE|nr:uncharacterized protein CI109_000471 [Kwoniella shandongensis]KAA5530901.1 hypothetical protein CI109_000471 [Kwoniella shandongensis]